jgi:UDP-glucose 4-epimerase
MNIFVTGGAGYIGSDTLLSLLEPLHAAQRASDLPPFWANAEKANNELEWQPTKTFAQMMEDAWRWQSKNLNGYKQND